MSGSAHVTLVCTVRVTSLINGDRSHIGCETVIFYITDGLILLG